MTQEQRDLLLKELCAKLPFGIKVQYENEIFDLKYVCPMYEEVKLDNHETWTLGVDEIKPYLFPLSSMTEEQHKEFYDKYCWNDGGDNFEMDSCSHYYALGKFDWLDKNHFDYRGLIPMGLAIDATGLNIY